MTQSDRVPGRVLIDSSPETGAWNMAVDEVLLDSTVSSGTSSLRWYRWAVPTLSLGYFRESSSRLDHLLLRDVPAVRRLSGGGALLHDHELTYSCMLPASHRLTRTPPAIYDAVHESIIRVLARHGVPAHVRGTENRDAGSEFLCFRRSDVQDVVVNGFKILGSAQRRRKGAVLQHGSLILTSSAHAPQIPGIFDLIPNPVAVETLIAEITQEMAALYGGEVSSSLLEPSEIAAAQALRDTQYSTLDWDAAASF